MAAATTLVLSVVRAVATYYLLRGVSTPTVTTSFDGTTDVHGSALARLAAQEAIVIIGTLVTTTLLAGMLTAAVGSAVLGQSTSARAVWREARPMIGRILAVVFLTFLVVFGAVLASVIPGLIVTVVGAGIGKNPLTVIGVVLLIGGGLGGIVASAYLQTALSFATPIVMLEKLGAKAALRRSRSLVRGDWWRVFGVTLLVGIISGAIAATVSLPFDFAGGIGSVFSGDPEKQAAVRGLIFGGIGAFLAGTLSQPVTAIGRALLYIDRRMRAEGLHLTLQQMTAVGPSADPATPNA
jgi:hypothetical protein